MTNSVRILALAIVALGFTWQAVAEDENPDPPEIPVQDPPKVVAGPKNVRAADWERQASEWAVQTYQQCQKDKPEEFAKLQKMAAATAARPLPDALRDAAKDRGFVLFSGPIHQLVSPRTAPTAAEANPEKLSLQAAADESESAVLGLWALKELKAVSVQVSDLAREGGPERLEAAKQIRVLTGYNVVVPELKKADAADGDIQGPRTKAKVLSGALELPFALLDLPAIDAPQDQARVFWIEVAVPAGTAAGKYRGHVVLQIDGKEAAKIPLELEVYPFDLDQAKEWGRGMFISRYRTRDELLQMREHGFNMMSWWSSGGTKIDLKNDKIVADFKGFQDYLKLLDETGYVGPHMTFMGASDPKIENRMFELLDRPVIKDARNKTNGESFTKADLSEPFGKYLCETLKQFHAQMKAVGHGDMKVCILDEPDHEPRPQRRDFYIKVFEMVEKGAPEVPTYGVFYHAGDEDRLSHHHDTWCTNRPAKRIAEMCRKAGKNLWTYGFGVRFDDTPESKRFSYGLTTWVYGANGSFMWANYWHGGEIFNPMSVTDKSTLSLPTPHGPLATAMMKGVREAIDDRRYIATLEKWIAKANAGSDKAKSEAAKHQAFLDSIRTPLFDKMTVTGGRPDLTAVGKLEITGIDGKQVVLETVDKGTWDFMEFLRRDTAQRILALQAAMQ